MNIYPFPRMLPDRALARERRLELESLNGEVVHRGGKHGVETPLNFAIYAALRPYVDGAPAVR